MSVSILRQAHFALDMSGPRLRAGVIPTIKGIRKSSAKAGEGKRGHLHVGPNEGIFFVNSKYNLPIHISKIELTCQTFFHSSLAGPVASLSSN